MAELTGKKVAMVIAFERFRDEELLAPKALLERQGAHVDVVSSRQGMALGKLGARVPVDRTLDEVRAADYDAIAFVGGPGCKEYFDSAPCLDLARDAASGGKVVAAICSAGGILAKAGLLEGLSATCYPTEAELLKAHGATYTARPLERARRGETLILTADGPQSATPFGAEIAAALAAVGERHSG